MNFKPRGAWWLESECGRYSVSKMMVDGSPKYSAWHGVEIIGGPYTNSAEPKKVCADHKAKRVAA